MQITYKGFCALGGLTNPRLFSRTIMTPMGWRTTYYMSDY
jgi:hypothetical protein